MTRKRKMDVYSIITERVLDLLDKGTVPWRKPWSGSDDLPRNLGSGRFYRGINVWLLMAMGYISPYWVTFRQCDKMGGSIKKGQKGTPVIYWNWFEKKGTDDDTGEETVKRVPFLRYYTVFNVEQTEGLEDQIPEPAEKPAEFNPIEICEVIVENYPDPKCPIEHGGGRAAYSLALDRIRMPNKEAFDSPEEYYSTIFHEMIHSTGHQSRVNRKLDPNFGSDDYSQEELVAEMGASYMCGITSIEHQTLENSAAYIQNWRVKISEDKKLVVMAAAQAQKAVDWLVPVEDADEETVNDSKKAVA